MLHSLCIECHVWFFWKKQGECFVGNKTLFNGLESKKKALRDWGANESALQAYSLIWDVLDKEIPNIKNALNLAYAGFYNNGFNNLDASVSFWTSTEANDNAMKLYFHKSLSKAFSYHEKKSNAISVRCVKNQ